MEQRKHYNNVASIAANIRNTLFFPHNLVWDLFNRLYVSYYMTSMALRLF